MANEGEQRGGRCREGGGRIDLHKSVMGDVCVVEETVVVDESFLALGGYSREGGCVHRIGEDINEATTLVKRVARK